MSEQRGETGLQDLRDGWMNEVEMTLELSGDRVGQRTDRLHTGVFVGEYGEVGVEQRVRLADWNFK